MIRILLISFFSSFVIKLIHLSFDYCLFILKNLSISQLPSENGLLLAILSYRLQYGQLSTPQKVNCIINKSLNFTFNKNKDARKLRNALDLHQSLRTSRSLNITDNIGWTYFFRCSLHGMRWIISNRSFLSCCTKDKRT